MGFMGRAGCWDSVSPPSLPLLLPPPPSSWYLLAPLSLALWKLLVKTASSSSDFFYALGPGDR